MPSTTHPFAHLSADQLDELAREFDAIHDQVRGDLGERDRRYIKGVIRLHRQIAVAGRALLLGSRSKVAWTAGTGCLAIAKILENMEIGHNVLHGQWDWMNDPYIHSSTWDWDTASTATAWKHSHNYIHHTYTNIRGKDKDLGYEIMRIDPHQKWHPAYLAQPLYNLLLMAFFEWGVAVHDLDVEAIRTGEKPMKDVWHDLKGISGKARDQILKDYVGWPLVSALAATAVGRLVQREPRSRARVLADRARGRRRKGAVRAQLAAARAEGGGTFAATFWADFTANIIRNLWAHSIIFCGHFPDQTYTFSQEEVRDETRGGWYVRQLVGAANITGSPLFHLLSGNLGYQVEHHLFPDMPSSRYAEIAPQVREICRRYGLPYNTGPFSRQLGTVHRTILRLAFPGGKVRPKPGPYQGDDELRRAA
ncbi:acyl-CoA desaturase [Amycolatopsis sp. NPDC051061]|uniref:fatty acid desaturase family protein n=1 Tax=Amycolatopsis sp. NPDC051061 TaxID=3155042 RepID=UPI00341BC387